MKPAPFAYVDPETIEEAVALLTAHGDEGKLLAGGQSLLPVMNFRLAQPAVLIDLNRVDALLGIAQEDGSLRIGAMTRQGALERWVAGRREWGMLAEALALVGHAAIRSRGTIGGSIAHADPAAELPAALLALNGEVVARGPSGERTIPGAEFFLGPLTTALQPEEILTEIRLPSLPAGASWGFQEVARRHGDFALVGAAAVVARGERGHVAEVRLTLFAVGDTPVRATEAEQALAGGEPTSERIEEAARLVGPGLSPSDDLHATAGYRAHVAGVLSERALSQAVRHSQSEVEG